MPDADPTDARTRLREAALDLFGRQGVRDTSTRQILAAAGLRNPSAITYHFGSKADLVEDIVADLYHRQRPVLERQVELAAGPEPPSVEAWAAVAVDSAATLVSTERGCLLAHIWWEYDGYVRPYLFEEFLAARAPSTIQWMDAAARTLPHLPRSVAIARNIAMFRTLEWMIARRAGRILTGRPAGLLQVPEPEAFRRGMQEVAVGILSAPTTLTDTDLVMGT